MATSASRPAAPADGSMSGVSGPPALRDGAVTGVRAYLETHRFGNAETGDLWAALGEASQLPVGRVMRWTRVWPLPPSR